MDRPRNLTPSGMLARVVGHVEAARAALRTGSEVPAPIEPLPLDAQEPDPLHIAAALIVDRIRHDRAADSDESHIAWVRGVLREIERGRR